VNVHFARVAKLAPQIEVVGYADDKSRIGDFILPFFNNNNEVLSDVSCLHPLYGQRVSKPRGWTAQLAVNSKLTARKADDNGYIETTKGKVKFVPLGYETLGGFSKNSIVLVRCLAKEWESVLGLSSSVAALSMVKTLSLEIWRCNARSLLTERIRTSSQIDPQKIVFTELQGIDEVDDNADEIIETQEKGEDLELSRRINLDDEELDAHDIFY
jgi:hypothetical protein